MYGCMATEIAPILYKIIPIITNFQPEKSPDIIPLVMTSGGSTSSEVITFHRGIRSRSKEKQLLEGDHQEVHTKPN